MDRQKSSLAGESVKLSGLIEKIGLDVFEKLLTDLLECRRADTVKIDISESRSILGIERKVLKDLERKYKIDSTFLRKSLGAVSSLLRTCIATEKEDAISSIRKDNKLADIADKLVEIATNALCKYPEVCERYYLATFCKTQFLQELEWEVVMKALEPPVSGFEKGDRFLACVLRFALEKPALLHGATPEEGETQLVFEVSMSDINKLIATLSTIRDRMVELKRELLPEGVK